MTETGGSHLRHGSGNRYFRPRCVRRLNPLLYVRTFLDLRKGSVGHTPIVSGGETARSGGVPPSSRGETIALHTGGVRRPECRRGVGSQGHGPESRPVSSLPHARGTTHKTYPLEEFGRDGTEVVCVRGCTGSFRRVTHAQPRTGF